jgi:hypothetical protein
MLFTEDFIQWLKFNPVTTTMEGWEKFDARFRAEAPFRYFLTKTLRKRIFLPVSIRSEKMARWLMYRIIPRHRYHLVDIQLKPGYYEPPVVMLNAMFSILVDFVEISKGWRQLSTGPDEMYPGWFSRKFGKQRYPEQGIKYLEWEASLDLDPACYYPEQAVLAREVLCLYKWWKNKESLEPSYDSVPDIDFRKQFNPSYRKTPEYAAYALAMDEFNAKRELFEKEQEEMFLRLATIRGQLWT